LLLQFFFIHHMTHVDILSDRLIFQKKSLILPQLKKTLEQ